MGDWGEFLDRIYRMDRIGKPLCVALRISACDKFNRVENVDWGGVCRPTVGGVHVEDGGRARFG